jgi:hypothetical protein
MRLSKSIGMLCIAVCVILSAAPCAFAEEKLPENLPAATTERTLTGDGSTVLFQTLNKNGVKIECSGSSMSEKEKVSTHPEGSYSLDIRGCKGTFFGVPVGECKTLGDAKETILSSGNWKLAIDVASPELKVEVWFEPVETTIECAGGNKLVLKGNFGCLHVNPTVKTKDHEFKCKDSAAGSGDPEDTGFINDKGEEVKSTQLCSTNGGAFETCAWEFSMNLLSSEEIFADI